MSKVRVIYDGVQHCTAMAETTGKSITVGAGKEYGGTGQELSPIAMVGSSLGCCMLLAMGTLALRDGLDISGTTVDIEVSLTKEPLFRIGAISLLFQMPKSYSKLDRMKLERAAEMCPIKPSFHPEIPLSVQFGYPARLRSATVHTDEKA